MSFTFFHVEVCDARMLPQAPLLVTIKKNPAAMAAGFFKINVLQKNYSLTPVLLTGFSKVHSLLSSLRGVG